MFLSLTILLVGIALGFPIYLCILISSFYLLTINGVPPIMVVTAMFDGVNKFTLTAVPFFILAGNLMQNSTMAEKLVSCVSPWFARVRGGIAVAAVAANEIFGAMSGSTAAAVGTIGRTMFGTVKETHGDKFALGLFTSCGSLAIIMPPSIAMILFAIATNTSIGALFAAGIIPALITGVIISAFIIYKSKPLKETDRFDLKLALKNLWNGIPVLVLPIIILGGIYTGVFSPTEAGAIGAAYSLLLPLLFYREIGWKEIKQSLIETVEVTGKVFILCACSAILAQALAVAQIPAFLQSKLQGLNPYVFLFLLNIVLLFVGCFFDSVASTLIIAPVVASIAVGLGIDLVHLGLVFVFNLSIGMFTPPFGLNIFVMQSMFKRTLEEIGASVVPFFILFLIALFIFTFFPQIYLWVPKLLLSQ